MQQNTLNGDMPMLSITEFLEARIAENERAVMVASDYGVTKMFGRGTATAIVVQEGGTRLWSTDQLLAECAAKRTILTLHRDNGASQGETDTGYGVLDHACATCGSFGEYGEEFPCGTVTALASVYADHPDYQQEWAL